MKIKVTQADIEEGRPEDCHLCPVALAVARAFDVPQYAVSVDGLFITVNDVNYDPPKLVDEFIYAFDEGDKVIPFEFDLAE